MQACIEYYRSTTISKQGSSLNLEKKPRLNIRPRKTHLHSMITYAKLANQKVRHVRKSFVIEMTFKLLVFDDLKQKIILNSVDALHFQNVLISII